MAGAECGREAEVIRAAWGDGPVNAEPEILAHAQSCESCREIMTLAAAFRAERNATCAEARVPTAGLVWWRAQIRARQEAAARAARPIAFVHAVALGCTAAAAVAFLGLGVRTLGTALPVVGEHVSWKLLDASLAPAAPFLLPTGVLVLAASLVLVPVAVYFAVRE